MLKTLQQRLHFLQPDNRGLLVEIAGVEGDVAECRVGVPQWGIRRERSLSR